MRAILKKENKIWNFWNCKLQTELEETLIIQDTDYAKKELFEWLQTKSYFLIIK